MAKSFVATDLAARLRTLQGSQDWTVQEMAALAGLPKRSLENYMRKTGPQIPSAEVLAKMAEAYGVPVDWLLFGAESVALNQARLVRLCARSASVLFTEAFQRAAESLCADPANASLLMPEGKLLGMTPEEWAMEIATEAGKRAEGIVSMPNFLNHLKVGERVVNDQAAVMKKPLAQSSKPQSDL